MQFSLLTSTVVSLFFILLVGFAAAKCGFIDKAFSKKLSTFVICIGQPFLVMGSLVGTEYSLGNLKEGGLVVLFALSIFAFSGVAAFFAAMPYRNYDERKIAELGMVFANTAFMGYPVLEAVFGDIGRFYGAFYALVFNVVLWTYGVSIMARRRGDIRLSVKKMFLNFGTVPCAIGVLLYVLPFEIPHSIVSAMNLIGGICTPCSMFIIGGLLATIPAKSLFADGKIYYYSLIKLLAIPIAAAAIVRVLGFSPFYVRFAAVMTALPSASTSAMYAEKYDIAPAYGAKIVGVTTFFSAFTVPLVLLFVERILL